jgi:hypothetical protein
MAGSPVNAERWRIATAIFHAALERPADRRPSFLAEACREDQSLRANVEALLAGDDGDIAGDRLPSIPLDSSTMRRRTTPHASRRVSGWTCGSGACSDGRHG